MRSQSARTYGDPFSSKDSVAGQWVAGGAAVSASSRGEPAAISIFAGIAFVIAIATIAHLLLSSHGFNPTDEGYYLSNARRILDGEVPHRDFITLRPAGAYLLFAPVVAFAGDSALWVARFFVWVEIATIAWLWAMMVNRQFDRPFGMSHPVAPAVVAFALIAGWYPIDVSTTIEGYTLYTIGLALVLGGPPRRKTLGYFVMGASYLCRQNLLFAGLLTLFILEDWCAIRNWLAAMLPGMLYVGWLAGAGGIPDFMAQLTAASTNGASPGGFFSIGIQHWVVQPRLAVGLIGGAIAGMLLRAGTHRPAASPIGLGELGVGALLALGLGGSVFTLRYGHVRAALDFRSYSFVVAGALAGVLLTLRRPMPSQRSGWKLALCCLAMAWALSFSWAVPSPVLATGPLALVTAGVASTRARSLLGRDTRRVMRVVFAVVTIPTAAIFYLARQGQIGFDRPAAQLTKRLDGVFPGGRHLYTDERNFAYLADFRDAVGRVSTRDVVVAPDLAAYWVAAPRRNPISINWPYWGELINARLEDRINRELDAQRGSYTVVVSKVMVPSLADGFTPLSPAWSPTANRVRATFTKVGETRFFELYR